MRNIILFLCSFLVAFPTLSENTSPMKTLVVGSMLEVDTTHPTYQIMEAAYRDIGFEIVLLNLPYARSWYEGNRGNILDAELARTDEMKPEGMIRVNVPFYTASAAVFTNDPDFKPRSWEELRGKRIDLLQGTTVIASRLGDIPVNPVTSIEQALLRVSTGRSDLTVLPSDFGKSILEVLGLENVYQVTPELQIWELYHYVHKRHEHLVPELTQAIQAIIDNKNDTQVVRN